MKKFNVCTPPFLLCVQLKLKDPIIEASGAFPVQWGIVRSYGLLQFPEKPDIRASLSVCGVPTALRDYVQEVIDGILWILQQQINEGETTVDTLVDGGGVYGNTHFVGVGKRDIYVTWETERHMSPDR